MNGKYTAGQQLTKRRKQIEALTMVSSALCKECFVVHTSVCYTQANVHDVLIGAAQMDAAENLIILQAPQRQA